MDNPLLSALPPFPVLPKSPTAPVRGQLPLSSGGPGCPPAAHHPILVPRRAGGPKSRARNHVRGGDGRAGGGERAPGPHGLFPPTAPKNLLSGLTSRVGSPPLPRVINLGAAWGRDGGAGDRGVGRRDADVPGDGDWGGEARQGEGMGAQPRSRLRKLSLPSKRCWVLQGRTASLFACA